MKNDRKQEIISKSGHPGFISKPESMVEKQEDTSEMDIHKKLGFKALQPKINDKDQKPEKLIKKILVLAANPKNTGRLRLDEEIREISEGLRRSKYRNQFEIDSIWAVRLRDIRRALLDFEPDIVHFTGHGITNGLLVENEMGFTECISPEAIAGLFELFSNQVECVIFNTCCSVRLTKAIGKHIKYVIGMRREIRDKVAIEFIVGFYDALGAGKTVEEAFKFGLNAIQMMSLHDHLIPILKKRCGA